jgi:sodium--glutamate symport carrier gltS
VYFAGMSLYAKVAVLRNYDLTSRDVLLVYFFTTIGINARISDLLSGGRALGVGRVSKVWEEITNFCVVISGLSCYLRSVYWFNSAWIAPNY